MKWCDSSKSVVEWGSETIIIPYISPVDKRVHRYFVDFYIKVITNSNATEKYFRKEKPKDL